MVFVENNKTNCAAEELYGIFHNIKTHTNAEKLFSFETPTTKTGFFRLATSVTKKEKMIDEKLLYSLIVICDLALCIDKRSPSEYQLVTDTREKLVELLNNKG